MMNSWIRTSTTTLSMLLSYVLGIACSYAFPTDIESLRRDATIAQLVQDHEIAAVRDAIAQCRAGECDKALPVLVQHSDGGDEGASYVLAYLYDEGLGTPRSEEKALELLWKNVESGHVPSMLRLAELKQSDSPAEAVELLKMASNAGNVLAHLKLGNIAENGDANTDPNAKLAYRYFEKAMEAGQPIGFYHVARFHADGIAVSPNPVEANRLFQQAAMAGVPAANTTLGRRLLAGQGGEPDPAAAIGWLRRGAELGSTEAMVLLGQQFESGDSIQQSFDQAGRLYSAAAKRGDVAGRYHLAQMYLHGKGTNSDPVRAFVLLEGAKSLPQAESLYERLSQELSPDQLALARTKIQEAKAREANE